MLSNLGTVTLCCYRDKREIVAFQGYLNNPGRFFNHFITIHRFIMRKWKFNALKNLDPKLTCGASLIPRFIVEDSAHFFAKTSLNYL